MGETRVDLLHLLEDLRDAYPGPNEAVILTEIVANALDSGASTIDISADPRASTLTVVDNGAGMRRNQLRQYHDIAATTKTRGSGIGFAGVGIKLGLLVCDTVFTETRRGKQHVATSWRLSSKRRAPWKWVQPKELVEGHGTAVRLKLSSPLSPLLDIGYIERALYNHFEPLLDPTFDEILAPYYPHGVRFVLAGEELGRYSLDTPDKAALAVKLPRKRKPSAVGFMARHATSLPDGRRGIAISTFGKVIKRGWDWLGVTPADPDAIGGLIEAPSLARGLTLNKGDFIRVGQNGAQYLAYRKAIQEVVSRQLAEWGLEREGSERDRRRAARPVERDLEKILIDLADDFPLLSTLVERRSGGQRKLPMGSTKAGQQVGALVGGGVTDGEAQPGPRPEESEPPDKTDSDRKEPAPPPTGMLEETRKGPRRPTHYRLQIRFEHRPDESELSRLEQSTVWINEAHPAYRRAESSRSAGYHIALATAMALARLAVGPTEEHDFVTTFLAHWGKSIDKKPRKKRRRPKKKI